MENPQAADENDARLWAMFCHLGGLLTYLGIPLGGIIAPFVIWRIKRKEFPFVNDQGKEALNFQLSFTIYFVIFAILAVLTLLGRFHYGRLALIGLLPLYLLPVTVVILIIIATIKAYKGIAYRYPLTIRFIR